MEPRVEVLTARDVLAWGWSYEDLLRRLIALDRELLGADLPDAEEGTVAQWASVFAAQPELYAFLSPGPGSIVGYWHGAAISDAAFERAAAGELVDSEITTDILTSLQHPGPYNLYVVFIGVLPQYRASAGALIRTQLAQLDALESRGVHAARACSVAYTPDGARFLERQGFVAHGPHARSGTVYLRP